MREKQPNRVFLLVCLFITLFLSILDNTVTNMAGIYIASNLGGSSDIAVYTLVFFGVGCLLTVPLANPLCAEAQLF